MQNPSKHSNSSSALSDDSKGNQDGDQKREGSSADQGGDDTTVHAEGDDKGDVADEAEAEAEVDPSMVMMTEGSHGDDSHNGGSRRMVAATMVSSNGAGDDQMVMQLENVNVGKSSAVKRQKRRCELHNPPPGTPTCFICKKMFPSWKGVFGHMKLHPDRPYRGFMPPPTFSASDEQHMHATLANTSGGQGDTASVTLPPVAGGVVATAAENAPPAREALTVPDLNEEPTLEEVADARLDLNQPPPPEEDVNQN